MAARKKSASKLAEKAICPAIDVAEVVRRKFLPDVKVKRVGIGTDQLSHDDAEGLTNVSTIEIVLER